MPAIDCGTMAAMRFYGDPVSAPRMLLLNRVEFDPGCLVFALDQPLFLLKGDQVWFEKNSVAVRRASGPVEYPSGSLATWNRRYKLI